MISSCSFATCTDGWCPWLLSVVRTSPRLSSIPASLSRSSSSFRAFQAPSPPCSLLEQCLLVVAILQPSSHNQPSPVLDSFRGPATYTHFDLMLLLWCRKVLTVNESDRCQRVFSTRGHLVSTTAMSMMAPHWGSSAASSGRNTVQRRRTLEAWLVTPKLKMRGFQKKAR